MVNERFAQRVGRLREVLAESGIGALWVEPSEGFTYLSGLEPVSIERLTALIVPAAGGLRLVVPLLLRDECNEIDAEAFVWDDGEGPEGAVAAALSGIDDLRVQPSLQKWALDVISGVRGDLELATDPGALSSLRERKDAEEVAALRAAGRTTDGVVEWVGGLDVSGLAERRLGGLIQARYLELGARPFDVALVASGANAALPHHTGSDDEIAPDAPLLIDIGGALDGYWSDTTRVFFPDGLAGEVADVYEIVCAAYDAALSAVEPGVPCEEVDRAARSVIEAAGYGEAFLHRTGHGVGLTIHEAPYLRPGNPQPLEVGHVFSIEPGIYLAGRFGLRYENLVYLGPDGPEELNASPRHHPFPSPRPEGGFRSASG